MLSLPSAGFAVGFFGEISGTLGILTGIAVYIVLLARLTSLESIQQTAIGQRALVALRRAVWFKGVWGALGYLAYLLQVAVLRDTWWLAPLAWGAYLDALTGGLSISALSGARSWMAQPGGPFRDSYVQTLALTLLQGAAISLQLLLFALAFFVWDRRRRGATASDPAS